MTPFTVGQEVTLPHSNHTTGGMITAIDFEDGVQFCTVRNLVGAEIKYRSDALYAKLPARDAAREFEAERIAFESAVEAARFPTMPPAPAPRA